MNVYRVHTDFEHDGGLIANGDIIILEHATGKATLIVDKAEKLTILSDPMLIVHLRRNAKLLCKV